MGAVRGGDALRASKSCDAGSAGPQNARALDDLPAEEDSRADKEGTVDKAPSDLHPSLGAVGPQGYETLESSPTFPPCALTGETR